jgi:hypothetical protein
MMNLVSNKWLIEVNGLGGGFYDYGGGIDLSMER